MKIQILDEAEQDLNKDIAKVYAMLDCRRDLTLHRERLTY